MERRKDLKRTMDYIRKWELSSIFTQQIIDEMDILTFEKGELVCSKGQPLNRLMFLVEGKLKVYIQHEDGKDSLLRFIGAPSIYGDLELFTDLPVLCHVEPIKSKAVFLSVGRDIMKQYAENHIEFMKYLVVHLSSKLYTISNSTSINLQYSLKSRLASYLLSTEENNKVVIPSLNILAPLLASSYRHLTRVIKELSDTAIIEKRGKHIRIINKETLTELAQGNVYEEMN